MHLYLKKCAQSFNLWLENNEKLTLSLPDTGESWDVSFYLNATELRIKQNDELVHFYILMFLRTWSSNWFSLTWKSIYEITVWIKLLQLQMNKQTSISGCIRCVIDYHSKTINWGEYSTEKDVSGENTMRTRMEKWFKQYKSVILWIKYCQSMSKSRCNRKLWRACERGNKLLCKSNITCLFENWTYYKNT